MIVEFLGTGTSQGVPVLLCDCSVCQSNNPRDQRLRSSVAISQDDFTIVIDVGTDFRSQILRSSVIKLDGVLLTHEHNDHVAGLDDLRPFNFRQKSSISLYGMPRVLDEVKQRFYYAFQGSSYPGAPSYELHAIHHGESFKLGPFHIQAFEVMHGNLPILAYRINDFVYITDAKVISKDSRAFAQNSEVLVINALRKQDHWSHFTLEESLQMIDVLKAKRNYLTHISHLLGNHDEINIEIPSHVKLAYDGLKIEI